MNLRQTASARLREWPFFPYFAGLVLAGSRGTRIGGLSPISEE
jgi:hypothetical protein